MRNLIFAGVLLVSQAAMAQRIVTIAGMGPSHRAEVDGHAAQTVPLDNVFGVLLSRSGRLLFHDEGLVERLEPDGSLVVVAGARSRLDSSLADATPASALTISILRGMAEDASGALYVSDAGVGRVFRIGSDGRVKTVASGAVSGQALVSPRGLAFDSKGTLFIAETACHCIRQITRDGTFSTFYTLPSSTAFHYFEGLAIDVRDNLYAAEYAGDQVIRISPDGIATTVAGTGLGGFSGDWGPAIQAQLSSPSGVAVTADGTLYIADTKNHRIRRVTPDGVITTIAGTGAAGLTGDGGPAVQAQLNLPAQIQVAADGTLYFSDYGNRRLRQISKDGTIGTLAGSGIRSTVGPSPTAVGDGGPAITATLSIPSGLVFDTAGNLLVSEFNGDRVRQIAPDGTIRTLAETVGHPFGLTLDSVGALYLPSGDSRVRRVDPGGAVSVIAGTGTGSGLIRSQGDGGPATAATLNEPKSVAVDAGGNIYIADTSNARLRVIDRNGIIRTASGPGQQGADYWNVVAIDPQGAIYVAITHLAAPPARLWSEIDRVNNDGSLTRFAGNGQGCTDTTFSYDGRRALEVPLCIPIALYFDDRGNLFIGESYYGSVLRVGPDGLVTRVAATAQAQSLGDGGPALNASAGFTSGYFAPAAVVTDRAGNLYFAGGDRIREVTSTALVAQVSPVRVDFTAAGSQTIAVKTNFAEPFPYVVTISGAAWLSANRTSGLTGEPLTLSADTKGLSAGTYRATVTIQIASADPLSVDLPVTLTVR
jgi:sugar lactone lactonase YvrE